MVMKISDRVQNLESQLKALNSAYQATMSEVKNACKAVITEFFETRIDPDSEKQFKDARTERENLLLEIKQNKLEILNYKNQLEKYVSNLIGLELHIKRQQEEIQNLSMANSTQCNENNVVIHVSQKRQIQNYDDYIRQIFKNLLEIDPIIRNVTCLKNKNFESTFLVKIGSKADKSAIFRNCWKLRNFDGKISILDDVSFEERIQRRKLAEIIRQEKGKGNGIQLRGTELKIKQKRNGNHQNIGYDRDLSESYSNKSSSSSSSSTADGHKNVDLAENENNSTSCSNDDDDHARLATANEVKENFWQDKLLRKAYDDLATIGQRFNYSENKLDQLIAAHLAFNRGRILEDMCICNDFWHLPLKQIETCTKGRLDFDKKFLKEYKRMLQYTQNHWENFYSIDADICFCNHFTLHIK